MARPTLQNLSCISRSVVIFLSHVDRQFRDVRSLPNRLCSASWRLCVVLRRRAPRIEKYPMARPTLQNLSCISPSVVIFLSHVDRQFRDVQFAGDEAGEEEVAGAAEDGVL
jgi:hypothetical protein